MDNEGWTPPANTNFYLKDPVSCMAGMRSFQQYSGQCWSDATSVFMLYSFGLGSIFQKAFQIFSKEALEKEFTIWAGTPESKKFIYSIIFKEQPDAATPELKDIVDGSYIYLINALAQYLVCLQRRFLNSITPHETLRLKARTCNPKVYSFCKEESGRYVYTYMNPIVFKSRGELAHYDTLIPFNAAAAKTRRHNILRRPNLQNNQIQSFLPEGQQGGLPSLFSKCIPVYMAFFNHVMNTPQPLFATNVLNQPDTLEASLAPFGPKLVVFSDILQSMKADKDPGILETQILSIRKLIEQNYKISIILTVNRYDEVKGHVISLLECENGETVLYDDNINVMVGIPWKDMFEMVNEEIPEILYISTDTISTREEETLRQAITTGMLTATPPLVDFYLRLFLQSPVFLTIYAGSGIVKVFKKNGSVESLEIPSSLFEFELLNISNLINVFCYKVSAFATCVFQPRQVGGSKMALRRARQTRRQVRRRRSLTRRR
jgi:hypothetical protein